MPATSSFFIAGDSIRLLAYKCKAYFELFKFRLSATVVFSSFVGYMLSTKLYPIDYIQLTLFLLSGFLITGAANIINQILEVDYDKLMSRTCNRPLPSGRISKQEAIWIAVISFTVAFYLLFTYVNIITTFLSVLSLILYGFVYTPLKRVGPLAVFVGAFPGALPPLIGWTAAGNDINVHALILFGIQFIWQFPHFWAIAWVLDDDYKKAGFKLLPSAGRRDINTAFQIMMYVLFLIPLGLLPARFGLTGYNSALISTIVGVLFLIQTFSLMRDCSSKSAKRIMFGSFIYLLVMQIVLMIDKI